MKNIDWSKISRQQVEIAIVAVILVCALSVWLMPFGFTKKLTFDHQKIVYVGKVKNNKMNGRGTLTFDNGDRYTGNFINGKIDGRGTYTSKDGWRYEGEFSKGVADGRGTLITSDGKRYEGEYKQGIYQK